jgi:hypothetical protein
MERVYPVLHKTPYGERARPVKKSDLDKMLEAGTAVKVDSSGIYREVEPVKNKEPELQTQEMIPDDQMYETRDMVARKANVSRGSRRSRRAKSQPDSAA